MPRITNEELIENLNCLNNKTIEINLEGTITTSIKLNIEKTTKTKDYISIIDKENKQNIKLNLHQIMKIEVISNNEFIIYFDNLQTIKIKA